MALPSFQARPLWGAPFGNLFKLIIIEEFIKINKNLTAPSTSSISVSRIKQKNQFGDLDDDGFRRD